MEVAIEDLRHNDNKAQGTKSQRDGLNKTLMILQPVQDSIVQRLDATSAQ